MNASVNKLKEDIPRGVSWAWFVFFSQIPFVFWFAKGGPALHPIVVMLPLVGILNFYVEKRDWEGLGLRLVNPGRSLLLALLYSGLSILGKTISLNLERVSLQVRAIATKHIWELVLSFLVGVFIIALWEEIVNRGYIQTRLQTAWGFWGVIVATLLFAAMHIPSALLGYGNDLSKVAVRFLEVGLAGFALGYIYWRSRSVLTTIAIHGLNNFAVTGVLPLLTGVSAQKITMNQSTFQLVWLTGQVVLISCLSNTIFRVRFSNGPPHHR
jgi:membrane protease YdiL (CAAX protease family)